ncbi:bestrophin homolog [Elysia marginata]|uniref:Bestrophin homolog n=1 Tax=Elysia marginata TaxID=1093978 RepID=A0AAV4J809_9GAST|nr:bestrophin homolog [Elysia marginata]
MGWLKVAEQMINPFGEDDDDYDINWLIDRHTAVAFALVDQCSGVHPPLMKDAFWNDLAPDVPYTESSLGSVRPNFLGSTFNVRRPSIDVERFLHEEDFQAVLGGYRSKNGSMSGSLLSLLPFRGVRSHDNSADAQSAGSQGARFLSAPQQGKPLYQALGARGRRCTGYERVGNSPGGTKLGQDGGQTAEGRRLSDHTPYRSRTLNEYDAKESGERERKLSLPFNVHLSVRNRQRTYEKSPTESPKLSRFTVEPVMEEEQTEPEPEKTRRPGSMNTFSQNNGVSRVPILSAIEEGNSVTSMEQMFSQKPAQVAELIELRDIPEMDNEEVDETRDDVFGYVISPGMLR